MPRQSYEVSCEKRTDRGLWWVSSYLVFVVVVLNDTRLNVSYARNYKKSQLAYKLLVAYKLLPLWIYSYFLYTCVVHVEIILQQSTFQQIIFNTCTHMYLQRCRRTCIHAQSNISVCTRTHTHMRIRACTQKQSHKQTCTLKWNNLH